MADEEEQPGELKQIGHGTAKRELDSGVEMAIELIEETADPREAREGFAVDRRDQANCAGFAAGGKKEG